MMPSARVIDHSFSLKIRIPLWQIQFFAIFVNHLLLKVVGECLNKCIYVKENNGEWLQEFPNGPEWSSMDVNCS